mgnify:CR=1 FL=1
MAIVKNFWLQNQKKKLAGAVIYQAMGQTRSRELAASVANPRTESQMTQRVKWANLVNFYRANKGWMKFAYETKKQSQSDYNKFMSLNVASSRIYIPKGFAAQGACVVDSYQMTQGSLASIETSKTSTGWATNLFLTNANAIPENPTIGEVSRQLLEANPALREGDQISFIRLTQQTNANTGVPFVVVRKYEVILNSSSVKFFYDYMPIDYIVFDGGTNPNRIEVNDSGNAGGFLLILSRTTGGKTYVSTQSVVVANNASLIDAYSSTNALQTAIDSYGESAEPFLTSTVAEADSQAAVSPSIVAVKIEDDPGTPGSTFLVPAISGGDAVEITFNQEITGNVGSAQLTMYVGGEKREIVLTPTTGGTNKRTADFPSGANYTNAYIADIVFQLTDGTSYRAVFYVPNEATISGLE